MGFDDAILKCLSKYATFYGRARPSEFWWFMALYASALLVVLVATMVSIQVASAGLVLAALLTLPAITVTVRRLHDVGKSGWLLVFFIPIAGQILLLAWLARPGVRRLNRFGPEPVEADARHLLFVR